MALRTACLCDGKVIGIESIFTVIDGKQINIPEKVEALRFRSKNKELFCPCGCGSNLTLVAGDKNLREQHFRMKNGRSEQECHILLEGETSIYSKIVLKCWLDEKLNAPCIETRVPICTVEDSERKYEMSFYVPDRKLAVSYCNNRANLSDEKLSILDANSAGIRLVYITDISNTGNSPQYPEMMMKVQKRQGYCLFLQLHSENGKCVPDYSQAELKAFFYLQAADGTWTETQIAEGKLRDFEIACDGGISFRGQSLSVLMQERENAFYATQKRIKEEWQKAQAEKQRREEERVAWAKHQQAQRAKANQARIKAIEEARESEARASFYREMSAIISQHPDTPLIDNSGKRWIKCMLCGSIDTEDNFISYGGLHRANIGTCKDCYNLGFNLGTQR